MSLSTLFPVAFPALALAHFVALLSPGQDFFLIVAHSIRHKLKGSRFICLGVALGNAIYIGVAIFGWTSIRDNKVVFSSVEILGALYLLWLGIALLRSTRRDAQLHADHQKIPSAIKQLMLGLNSALLNPKNALFYMSLMTVILGNDVTLTQQVSSGVWMFLAVLLWDLFIASVIGLPRVQERLSSYIHVVEKAAGIVLMFFGITLFFGYLR
ncbi:threonine transporter RhtB [Photobacterium gaetbulicola]|uniref:Lysine exporter protein LysE/YggA n=1 Tax=Photobacterium gaetbulicola Gung47 TaxID=658445 RepID=A0A0C5W4U9_9GAMM|nr:LysE family transporter [Photobacterium gaetbulicola]AJR06501.1 lysine exporter protein LysE/YggA [Photobacterium gaetbulicola Gung47]PSU03577.1 threonine transporter RhtB [Photobacterium gaetbulicola]